MRVAGCITVRPVCAAGYTKVCNACFLYSVSSVGFLLCKMGGWWPVTSHSFCLWKVPPTSPKGHEPRAHAGSSPRLC